VRREKKSHLAVALKVPEGTSLDFLGSPPFVWRIFVFSHCDSSWLNFTGGT
jgi:hypothetical protein